MKTVFVCSPLKATHRYSVWDNIKYASLCCRLVLKQGHAPFAPHLMYPWFLRSNDPVHQQLGSSAAQEYLRNCDELWCFLRHSMDVKSEGMKHEVSIAVQSGIPVYDVFLPDDLAVGTAAEVIVVQGCRATKLPWVVPEVPMFADGTDKK